MAGDALNPFHVSGQSNLDALNTTIARRRNYPHEQQRTPRGALSAAQAQAGVERIYAKPLRRNRARSLFVQRFVSGGAGVLQGCPMENIHAEL